VSDEALTQAIFRARAVLGAQGERIVTVRGIGIRFDAPVQREEAGNDAAPFAPAEPPSPTASTLHAATPQAAQMQIAESSAPTAEVAPPAPAFQRRATDRPDLAPTPAPATMTLAATHSGAASSPRGRRTSAMFAALLFVAAVAAWKFWPAAAPAWVDEGYGIAPADVHAARADSLRLLGEAVRYDNTGDRARARALLEALHDADATTPWPAMLLGLWSIGAGDLRTADTWLAQARERAAPLHDTYIAAMLRYIDAERDGGPQDVVRYAGAVLDLRHDAWRMHLARAHLKNYQGLREAALTEIRQIPIRELGNRKLEGALADRASFGDVAGAQAVLERLPRTTDAAAWEYLSGRIAWSRGDRAAARQAWERAAAEAQKNGRSDIGNRALANAGLAAMLGGDTAAAIAHFERARVGMHDAGWVTDEIDLSLLLTQLHARAGRAGAAREEFERALAIARGSGANPLGSLCALVGARLFPGPRLEAEVEVEPAVQSLDEARLALNRGDRDGARAALQAAQQRGILDLAFADEARLLAAELGLAVAPERPLDPPYPPLAVAGARLALADRSAAPAP
jgi:hypothetical protein